MQNMGKESSRIQSAWGFCISLSRQEIVVYDWFVVLNVVTSHVVSVAVETQIIRRSGKNMSRIFWQVGKQKIKKKIL